MRVLIEEALFADDDQVGPLLGLILACGFSWEEHHHVVLNEDGTDHFKRWKQNLSEALRLEVETLMDRWLGDAVDPAYGNVWTVHIKARPSGVWRSPVLESDVIQAIEYLSRPVEIHVEDDTSDRAFLLAIAKREWEKRISVLEDTGRLMFFNGGGVPNMKKRLSRLKTSARRRRIWVMFDSDGLKPGYVFKESRELRKAAQHMMGYWLLKRRCIENYLPIDAVEGWAEDNNQERVFQAWEMLSEDHQRHFNMKKGLGKDQNREDFNKHRAFWANHLNISALQQGFNRIASMHEALYRSDYDADARAEADQELGKLLLML